MIHTANREIDKSFFNKMMKNIRKLKKKELKTITEKNFLEENPENDLITKNIFVDINNSNYEKL